MSDLHANQIGKNNEIVKKTIRELNPDCIVLAGDMVSDNGKNMDMVFNTLRELSEEFDIYYGVGNHEIKLAINPRTKKRYFDYRKRIIESGIHFMNNKSEYITRGNERIKICGLNISKRYYTKVWNRKKLPHAYVERRLGKKLTEDKNIPVIMIAHTPEYFNEYCRWGADIVISGHVHGGMVILPFVGGVIASSFELFPHYDFGEFNMKNDTDGHESKMYLTRGLGSHTIPLRINNPPEIMVLKMKKG